MKIGYVYLLTHSQDFPFIAYIGKTVNPKNRKSCHLNGHSASHNWKFRKFISKFGAKALKFEIIWEGELSKLNEMEVKLIKEYSDSLGKEKLFNICKGGEGIDPEFARKRANKMVADGTHPFLQESHKEQTRKRVKKEMERGVHPFSSELSVATNKKRIENGSHPFIGNKLASEQMNKRIASGIPYMVASNQEMSLIFWNNKELTDYGFNYTHAISVCKGRLKSHKGFKFMYHPKYKPRNF